MMPNGIGRLDPPSVTSDRRRLLGLLSAFVAITALAAYDLVSDAGEGITLGHLVTEGSVILLALGGSAMMVRQLAVLRAAVRSARTEVEDLTSKLADTRQQAQRWRDEARELLDGLGAAIDKQLTRWKLTEAEKEVALLLLKGLSHKEVAQARGVADATARQQARAVYKKSQTGGRNELAAFFLEDLLLPTKSRSA